MAEKEVLALNFRNVIVDNCQFKNNEAMENGAAIALYSNTNINVKNSFFTDISELKLYGYKQVIWKLKIQQF